MISPSISATTVFSFIGQFARYTNLIGADKTLIKLLIEYRKLRCIIGICKSYMHIISNIKWKAYL